MFSFQRAGILVALLVFSSLVGVQGQQQPEHATNAQDEDVLIDSRMADDDGLLRIFRTGDKQEANRYVSYVYPLKHAEALELIPYILSAVKLEGGTAKPLKYTNPDTGEKEYFLYVVTTERQLPSVLESIELIDLPGVTSSAGDLKYAVRMKNRRASEVARILANTSLSGEGEVYPDDISNTVWIDDSQSDGARNIAYIEFYDVPPPQVEFDVQVIEISESDSGKVGLDWDAWKRALGGQIDVTYNYFEGGNQFSRLDGLLVLDARVLASFLNYTLQTGAARTVHHSRVTASNEKPAVIYSAQRVPYLTYQLAHEPLSLFNQPVVTENTPSVDARDERSNDEPARGERTVVIQPAAIWDLVDLGNDETGIAIAIQPTIATDMVTASIDVDVQSIVDYNQIDEPIVASRSLNTMATLKDGEPFLLGSIRRNEAEKYRRGIPGLRSIPVIKYLFSVEGKRIDSSRLFIIATPKFKNQLHYASRTIKGSNPEKIFAVEPPLTDNNVQIPEEILNEIQQIEQQKLK
jgi:type II secretory pathway component GspD/PulD (secretin)